MRKDRGMEEFMESVSNNRGGPGSVVEHQYRLMDNEPGEVRDFASIFDKAALLAILKDDKFVRIYQRQMELLNILYGYALKDQRLSVLFASFRAQFFHEIGLTRAKEGEERKHQAALAGYKPTRDLQGFGTEEPEGDHPNQIDQARKFMRGFRRG